MLSGDTAILSAGNTMFLADKTLQVLQVNNAMSSADNVSADETMLSTEKIAVIS
jgi:hypothetical protein